MSLKILRVQLRTPVSHAGVSTESFIFTDEGKHREWCAKFVAGGVHVWHPGKLEQSGICHLPDSNILSVSFVPDEKPEGKVRK